MQINDYLIKEGISGIVKSIIDDALNGLLHAEASGLWETSQYERSPERVAICSVSCNRRLYAKANEVILKVTAMPPIRNKKY